MAVVNEMDRTSQVVEQRSSFSIEAVEMTLKNPFAHRRGRPAGLATAVNIERGGASHSRALRIGHFRITIPRTNSCVRRSGGARRGWDALSASSIHRPSKRIAEREPSKQACASLLLSLRHGWGRLLLAETACSACSPGVHGDRDLLDCLLFFKHRLGAPKLAVERERV
jgi:hypothetical protein